MDPNKPFVTTTVVRKPSSTRLAASIRTIAKTFKVQFIPALFFWRKKGEQKKVVIHRSRWIALQYSLFHLVPLTPAMTLVALNLRGYFLGQIPASSLTALQFAAKLLEVLIQTSLAAVLLSCVRYGMTARRSLPLGLVLAPSYITSLSYCWSLDFVSTFKRQRRYSWILIILTFLAPGIIILAAVVGPSTAVLLIPRRANTTMTPMSIFLHPMEDILPTQVVADNPGHLNYAILNQSLPQLEYVPGKSTTTSPLRMYMSNYEAVRALQYIGVSGYDQNLLEWPANGQGPYILNKTDVPNNSGWYTMPGRTIINAMQGVAGDKANNPLVANLSYVKTNFPQPLVEYGCFSTTYNYPARNADLEDLLSSNFFNFSLLNPDFEGLVSLADTFYNGKTLYNNDSADWLATHWTSVPANISSNTSILVTQLSWVNDTDLVGPNVTSLISSWVCAFDAYWWPSDITHLISAAPYEVILTSPKNKKHANPQLETSEKPIKISADWAAALYDVYTADGDPRGELLSLPVLLTYGLACIGPNMIFTSLYDLIYQTPFPGGNVPAPLTPAQNASLTAAFRNSKSSGFDQNGFIVGSDSDPWNDVKDLYVQHIYLWNTGYGYGTTNMTVRLALVVLILYIAIVVVYLICALTAGVASTAWDSVGELLMLGLNSPRPTFLGRTSGGIDTLDTYCRRVGIKAALKGANRGVAQPSRLEAIGVVDGSKHDFGDDYDNDDEGLQLIFEDDTQVDPAMLREVEENKAY